jgi:hypothetical protein
MVRGRRKVYQEPVVITLKTERELHDIAVYLRLSDTEVYNRGIMAVMEDRMGDLTEKAVHQYIQNKREKMKGNQDDIAVAERVAMDARIREDRKKRIETRHDERGREYQVVIAE